MGRDGSDSDWMNENGYGNLVRGEFPAGWGEDDNTPEFDTFKEASDWAKSNVGKKIKRNPNGHGFIGE